MTKVLVGGELGWHKSPRPAKENAGPLASVARDGAQAVSSRRNATPVSEAPVSEAPVSEAPEGEASTREATAGETGPAPGGQPGQHFRRVQPSDDVTKLELRRRHTGLPARLLHNRRAQLLVGLVVAIVLPAVVNWGWAFWLQASAAQWLALGGSLAVYLVAIIAVQQLSRLPGTRADHLVVPALTTCYGLLWGALEVLGLPYAGAHLLISYAVAVVLFAVGYLLSVPHRRLRLAVVPYGKTWELCQDATVDWRFLESPSLDDLRVDGVVADLRSGLSVTWQRFLADCTLHRIPVYHATSTFEMLTGRVSLHDNRLGSMQPDEGYEMAKRFLDMVGVLLLMPLLLPIMGLTALAIRLESQGPALFTQQRMGLHCRPFTVYKFRSMYINHPGNGFTQDGHDPRITRVGRVIRKYRIDELPQVFNVLKGDMSLIGPRPESMDLSEWYCDDVPYFHYRHVVRPGISGWAQVEQGYAAEVDGMSRKLEYDFYYIKHFSFWLDVLITIRTIRTILTGFGAR